MTDLRPAHDLAPEPQPGAPLADWAAYHLARAQAFHRGYADDLFHPATPTRVLLFLAEAHIGLLLHRLARGEAPEPAHRDTTRALYDPDGLHDQLHAFLAVHGIDSQTVAPYTPGGRKEQP